MQITEVLPPDRQGAGILLVTGFGAFRTLNAENGLHVLEEDQGPDGARRIVARVVTAPGPDRGLPTSGEFAAAAQLLGSASNSTNIVRRYREGPAPIVRDLVGGWRSGRLSAVLGGDFELIGAIKREQSRE
jgi:ATP-dependent Clp protease ATP-binding subunit ClpC